MNSEGLSAIHLLAHKGAIFALESLVNNGIDIKKRDLSKETVLFHGLGIGEHYAGLMDLYLMKGGNIDAINTNQVK